MMGFLRSLFGPRTTDKRLMPEALSIVTCDKESVTCCHPNENPQTVAWNDLLSVVIETNDSGPWLCDVFWRLRGSNSECIVPQGATGEKLLIDALQKLPHFDNEAMISAMHSVDNAQFECWKRS